jgi:hypothetical protein
LHHFIKYLYFYKKVLYYSFIHSFKHMIIDQFQIICKRMYYLCNSPN